MAEVGDKIVMTVKEKCMHRTGQIFYVMEGNNRWVFTEYDLKDFETLPFSPEGHPTLASITNNTDEGIIQRYLEFAKETGRDFHLTITAEGETNIDLTVPTKTVTESKFYSIPEENEDAGCEENEDAGCDTCRHYLSEDDTCHRCSRGWADKYVRKNV